MNRNPKASGKFAVICQSLYLANLLLLPGVFFLVLFYYYRQYSQLKVVNVRVECTVKNNEIRISTYRNNYIGTLNTITLISDNKLKYNLSLSFRYANGYQYETVNVKVKETSPSGKEAIQE